MRCGRCVNDLDRLATMSAGASGDDVSVRSSSEPELAGEYPVDLPGLPRGRHRLPTTEVAASHRNRLQRAAISAIARKGYAETTVADIVKGARVSRREFYQHFDDKQACFLAASAAGAAILFTRLSDATSPTPGGHGSGSDAGGVLVLALTRTYLDLCASEPEFTRCLIVELPAAGPEGLAQRTQGDRLLAALLRQFHAGTTPESELAPESMYLALVGAVSELVSGYLARGAADRLAELDETCAEVARRLLGIE